MPNRVPLCFRSVNGLQRLPRLPKTYLTYLILPTSRALNHTAFILTTEILFKHDVNTYCVTEISNATGDWSFFMVVHSSRHHSVKESKGIGDGVWQQES